MSRGGTPAAAIYAPYRGSVQFDPGFMLLDVPDLGRCIVARSKREIGLNFYNSTNVILI